MSTRIDITTFLELRKTVPVIDVRTPAEFEQGRVPGAYNIPLMDNAERAIVGTIYKHNGKQPAILKGLELAGPKLKDYIKQARKIPNEGTFIVHCWRGGMRSGFLSYLLSFYGFKIYTLQGGYKAFRRRMIEETERERTIRILGGRTGSGKTYVLQSLAEKGEQTVDLEALAHHKGSSFGSLGQEKQPSQEYFENRLGMELLQTDPSRTLWLEDESRTIGSKVIPEKLWLQMRSAPVDFIDLPFEERLAHIVRDYSTHPISDLITATERIGKRLGPQQTQEAVAALQNGKLQEGFAYSLRYYDKSYEHNLEKRGMEKIRKIPFEKMDPDFIADELIGMNA